MDSHLIIRRKFDHNRNKGEESDFPILCASCLGDNPYVRMVRASYNQRTAGMWMGGG